MLGEASSNSLRLLLTKASERVYCAQEALYHEGDACDTIFFVTSGVLKLIIHLRNGRERIVRLHGPGSILCLNGLYSPHIEHTAVAVTTVSALRQPVSALQHLLRVDPTAYASILESWCGYLRDADVWIAQFSTGPIRCRVARLLSFLSKYEADAANARVQLLTCEEMGSILGVTSESVSRVLAEFKRRQILTDHGGAGSRIYKPDLHQLSRIADE